MKSAFTSIIKMVLVFSFLVLVFTPFGCSSFSQPGETAAEGHRRHLRMVRINQQQTMADIDTALMLEGPSRLTDKRIP